MQSEFSEESFNTYDSDEDQKVSECEEYKEVKVVIFDWDNTLFCTSYLEMFQLDYRSIFSEQKSIEENGVFLLYDIQSLEESILNLFTKLIAENDVRLFIVTNADEKWIQNCLKHFMPELMEFLEENSIKFYSAKKLYGKHLSVQKWKTRCFKKLIFENFTERDLNLKVLSIGDSTEEKVAALALKAINYYHNLEVKFLQTTKLPDLNLLKLQFQYISENICELFSSKQFYHSIQIGVNSKT